MLRHYLIRVLLIIGVWGLIAVFYSLITTVTMMSRGENIMWLEAYGFELLCIWPWMAATPFIFRIVQNYPFKRPHLGKSILVHLSLALTIFVVHSINQSLAVHWFFKESILNGYILNDFIYFFNTRFALYAGVVLLAYLLKFYKKNHESRLSEARLKRQLNQAKYDAIRNRVQPLFVLGTLDAIEQRMATDPDHISTDKMIADFSELLRVMLDQRGVRLILLEDDFRVMDCYIQLLNSRLDLHLECSLDVDGKSTQAAIPYGLYLVSVFEYLVRYHLDKLRNLKTVYYQAHYRSGKIQLRLLFPEFYLEDEEIRRIFRDTNFDEINSGLQALYNKDYHVKLQCDKESNGFHIDLTIPFIDYTKFEHEKEEGVIV